MIQPRKVTAVILHGVASPHSNLFESLAFLRRKRPCIPYQVGVSSASGVTPSGFPAEFLFFITLKLRVG